MDFPSEKLKAAPRLIFPVTLRRTHGQTPSAKAMVRACTLNLSQMRDTRAFTDINNFPVRGILWLGYQTTTCAGLPFKKILMKGILYTPSSSSPSFPIRKGVLSTGTVILILMRASKTACCQFCITSEAWLRL